MLFFLVFYAPNMYAHAYILHDVLLLYNTTNLRILSSLGGDSEKSEFRICDYVKRSIKLHRDLGKKMNKTANIPKFKKKIPPVIATICKIYSTSRNLWTLLRPNVNIWSTALRGNSDLYTWSFVLSVLLKWIYYGTYGCHHHDADEKRRQRRKFQYPIVSIKPAKQVIENHKNFLFEDKSSNSNTRSRILC